MVSAGPVGAGLIFAIITLLNLIVLPIWAIYGGGKLSVRVSASIGIIVFLLACWGSVFYANQDIALVALISGLIVGVVSLFAPYAYKRIADNIKTHKR